MRDAISADFRYARPVISDVIAAAYARPSSESYSPSSRRNFMRFSEARLQAESSIDMYSEHGFDALMRLVFGSVCHALIVVSYWTPGSAHTHAAAAIWRSRSRASFVSSTVPSVRAVRLK